MVAWMCRRKTSEVRVEEERRNLGNRRERLFPTPRTSLDGLTPREFATRSRSDHNMNRASL